MAKKKPSKKSDQPELPLDAAVPEAGTKPETGNLKPEGSDASGKGEPSAASALQVSGLSSQVSEDAASAPPAAKRPKGQKVQDEQAPLALAYRNWFLDYASYVILDRAVPHIDDGLKPVQRRVLHTLWDMDDGRFHKVANVVGATMKLHPHGDASIGAALVSIAQRGWLIEPQGNFGNTLTGDDAAAPRYIEARLTPFAREVLFNPKTTTWQASYDGRTKEPVTLPAKFPIVLLEGADGIAVGLSTKILPHNFNDLCRAAINHLQGKTFRILPDFPTGGTADFTEYNDGERGGKVKVRAKIEERSKYLLAVTELPFGVTTESLIESILAANAKGKIKIKHVDDNTADKVEILIHLPQGAEADKVIQQLYVFTSCQVQLNPAACVIVRDPTTGQDKPVFTGVRDILKASADATKELLKRELEIKLGELEQQWHWDSLERIFIEERIYRLIEKSKTWESVLEEIRGGLKPFLKQLKREVTDDDIVRLTEIRIKRISAYNRFQADEAMKKIEEGIKETKGNLKKLTEYAVAWFEMLQEKYGKGIKRKTSYDEIEQIDASAVVSANQRLYVNREDGFIGLNWRQHEFVTECTILDSVLTIMGDASLKVTKVADKTFMGRDIRHVAIWPKDGDTRFYTMVYRDGPEGKCYAKKFQIGGLSRDKLYPLAKTEGSKLIWLDVAEKEKDMPKSIHVSLDGRSGARVRELDFDLTPVPVSTRTSKGLLVTKWAIKEVKVNDLALK
ncbi:DNA gyrase/topoisomerase IV subunit A [Oleiharenicola lentus]|uniref:DNA gyrase/topoisomerase IV subunit A n=1 Tax=Oleiharenicola lentus TaxID=2508720 RepID=A0A4Q1C8R4_9BACT|nr:DNA gyrase/topoisomerase IV subunit A [Oleiharenicola lentus]RXK55298.1 DNA gyrase/topoisomerase IV subunit A [Oleiharenicola lentus]